MSTKKDDRQTERTFTEILESLRREGWQNEPASVFLSPDKKLVKVVWIDGTTAEGRVSQNTNLNGLAKGQTFSERYLGGTFERVELKKSNRKNAQSV